MNWAYTNTDIPPRWNHCVRNLKIHWTFFHTIFPFPNDWFFYHNSSKKKGFLPTEQVWRKYSRVLERVWTFEWASTKTMSCYWILSIEEEYEFQFVAFIFNLYASNWGEVIFKVSDLLKLNGVIELYYESWRENLSVVKGI